MTETEGGMMLTSVKKFLPSFYADYLMSDDTNTFWNGFKKIPESTAKKLLCLWHKGLLEPVMNKVRVVCLAREKSVFVTKYTPSLNSYVTKATYMESSWNCSGAIALKRLNANRPFRSGRVELWAAFGRLGSFVNTSMLCERFHKRLKHDIFEGNANVRTDKLVDLIIFIVTSWKKKASEIMVDQSIHKLPNTSSLQQV
ncbi:hypothetical protein OESDEN_13249 [Oesophagostomum dentatum]|uniref:Uncharacterized protein n=1 Tax=Oesophagostomum dentatum TaxID=61180 RepID=A0A0B1SSW3_OESDE|nr:hypothetical protein OESDEN_13249 [Oesophagostomum dentatum]